MQSLPVAPTDLRMPEYVKGWLGRRSELVLDHGFGESVIGPTWWSSRLNAMRLPGAVTLVDHDGQLRLTRGDLFELGSRASDVQSSQEEMLSFLWSVLAWGTGRSQRGNAKRLHAFADDGPTGQARVALLRRALVTAAEGRPAEAYRPLVRRGGGVIPGLGPAFFTKALYFASEGTLGQRPLILDARVAGNLARAGWSSLPVGRSGYSYNWHTATYESYCTLLGRWAEEQSDELGQAIHPDEIELALFSGEQIGR